MSPVGQAAATALVLAASLGACGHQQQKQEELSELQRTVSTLRAQNATYLKEIAELQNEVFILRDRVETRQVAAQRLAPPQLPSVTLEPGRATPAPDAAPALRREDGEPLYATEVVTSPDGPVTIEYTGEAARRSDRRPVLRLVGDRGGVVVEDVEAARPPFAAPAERAAVAVVRSPRPPSEVPPRVAAVMSVPVPERPERAPPTRAPSALVLYRSALDQLNGGAHADAAAGFREFLRLYPTHDYADNAQYWLGEVYYDLKDFTTAAREFRRVADLYPNGNKVPDALLKLGFSHLSLGDEATGRRVLRELVGSFREHPAARLAHERLVELGDGPAAAPAAVAERKHDSKENP